ncbi:hypothetical protein P691DRAFT_216127 [Macrolepiota fuliginosa MF-IS2]|uniref:Uncharacterized protein n=1 Tax=Macrolepiota fuliginosa MF-IS2 TaxID=1400762 RepID=A0A9P6C272_9AGAR|nr:hypothetical protein P691DRAFT_216127 [Macrolepiota fuliginosa MF-IS2]
MTARPSTDVFRPCLPLDPFAPLDLGPWRPSISPHADAPNAVLILGDPAHTDLHPLLYSQSLAHSIVVLATHTPPHIPQTPSSAVRILRLSAPLAQDLSALRLVSLIERADRVVRRFRASGAEQSRKLVQLAEDDLTGEFVVEEPYSPSYTPSPEHRQQYITSEEVPRYPSPVPSETSSVSSFSSTLSHSSSSMFSAVSSAYPSHRRRSRAPPSSGPPADRAFDAIINFLPAAVPDKVLLKHAILVSTLTASFFAAPPMPSPPSSYSKPKNLKHRSSIFSNFAFSSSDAHFTGSVTEGSPTIKKNPRRFSALLRRQQDGNGHVTSELVQSAPCSRDSLSLKPSAGHLKGKSKSHQPQAPENQRKAHLIHILPAHVYSSSLLTGASGSNGKSKKHQHRKPKPKLVQSIEQFLLAFGYPLQSMSLLPSAPASAPASRRISTDSAISTFMSASVSGDVVGQEKPIPFLLPASVFGSVPQGGKLSIGEILLMGGLDNNEKKEKTEGVNGVDTGMGMGDMGVGGEGRVWIASPEDVAWDDLTSLSISVLSIYPFLGNKFMTLFY